MTIRRLFFVRTGLALAALMLASAAAPAFAQDTSEFFLRLNRLENQVREQSGTIEQLQFENRRLQDQLKRFQEDVEFRFQDLEGAKPANRQKRSDLPPAALQPGGPGAQQQTTQTTTPAMPASSISAQAVAGGDARMDAAAQPGGETADAGSPAPTQAQTLSAAPSDAGTQVETHADIDVAPSATPVLALPRIDTPALARPLEPGGPGSPLDLGAVAGAGSGDTVASAADAETDGSPLGIPSVAATAPGDPQTGFRLAEGALARQDFAAAEMAFREFLQSHPRDKLAPDAIFLLGESYFFRGRYREAAEQYLRLTTSHAASPRAPEGMLKLGLSLDALGARDQACATYAQTLRKFPAAGSEVREGIARARARAACA